MHFGTITTLLACTARSTVPHQRNAPVQNPLLLLRLINTLGSSIAVGCFRHRSPPDCEFATHKCQQWQHTSRLYRPLSHPAPLNCISARQIPPSELLDNTGL